MADQRGDDEIHLFMESMQQEIDMETQQIGDKYGFDFTREQPYKQSNYSWQPVKFEKVSQSLSKSQLAESNPVKVEKPRMMSVDYGRQSTHDDTVLNTQSDQYVLSARGGPGVPMNTTNGIIDVSRGEITPTSSAKSLKSLQNFNFKHGHSNSAFNEYSSANGSFVYLAQQTGCFPTHPMQQVGLNFAIAEDVRESHISVLNKSNSLAVEDNNRFDQVQVPDSPDIHKPTEINRDSNISDTPLPAERMSCEYQTVRGFESQHKFKLTSMARPIPYQEPLQARIEKSNPFQSFGNMQSCFNKLSLETKQKNLIYSDSVSDVDAKSDIDEQSGPTEVCGDLNSVHNMPIQQNYKNIKTLNANSPSFGSSKHSSSSGSKQSVQTPYFSFK